MQTWHDYPWPWVSLTWLLYNLQLWRHWHFFQKFTVHFGPVRKELESWMNNINYNWRLRWKKAARFLTQNWTLSKTLQILHAVLFRCAKQCSVCFLAEVFFVYEILRMRKSLYLWSHQHVTGKTVTSLILQQNIALLQCVTLKSVDFRVKPLQFWFCVNVRPQRR